MPEGTTHMYPLFIEIKEKDALIIDPRTSLFHDLGDADAKYWESQLCPMPSQGWNDTIYDCAWPAIASVYLVCKKDNCLPESWQRRFAEQTASTVVECDAGHMVLLSQPQTVVDVVIQAAEGKL
ncbi:MAG: hypothetical protein LQ340_004514 [Diploschistes diacapsis]|nr:MAG: hypothetical protein LQ340_004514 [Diploschistes diacapsis]